MTVPSDRKEAQARYENALREVRELQRVLGWALSYGAITRRVDEALAAAYGKESA